MILELLNSRSTTGKIFDLENMGTLFSPVSPKGRNLLD